MRNTPPQPGLNREPRMLTAEELTAPGGLYHTNAKLKELIDEWIQMHYMGGKGAEHEDSKRRDLVLRHINDELDGLSAKNSVFRLLKLSVTREELDRIRA